MSLSVAASRSKLILLAPQVWKWTSLYEPVCSCPNIIGATGLEILSTDNPVCSRPDNPKGESQSKPETNFIDATGDTIVR